MNQVAEKQNSSVALTSMFEQDANTSFSNMGSDDFALPFLRVLGQLSPETNKRDAKYVEGAEAGMIFNTVTKQLYDGEKGVNVIPCHYKREYVEWSDRGEGTTAPVQIHSVESGIIKEAKRDASYKDRLPNGNYLENTASYFVLLEDGTAALVSMKSTQLKVSRGWNSLMQDQFETDPKTSKALPAPMFSRIYNLSSVENSGSFTWHGYRVSLARKVDNA